MNTPSAASHSSLDLFQKTPVLINFDYASTVETHPITGLDGPTLEFTVRTDRNVFLDLLNITLKVCVRIAKNVGSTENQKDSVCFTNNTLHSLFSDCELYLNNELVSTSNGLYAHRAFISTDWSHTPDCKDSLLSCQGYELDDSPTDIASKCDKPSTELAADVCLMGRLAVDFFNCDKLLVPRTEIRIKLKKSATTFHLLTPKTTLPFNLKFSKASLLTRNLYVTDAVHNSIERVMMKTPARYTFTDSDAKTFIIPANQNSFIKENVFNGKAIRSIVIAMNTNAAFTGEAGSNPFAYKSFSLSRVVVTRNGMNLYDLSTEHHTEAYFNTIRSLHFDHSGPGIGLKEYLDHFVLAFDLTRTLQSNSEMYFPELLGSFIRIDLTFSKPLPSATEVLIIGEYLNTLYIKNTGEILKDGQ